MGHRFAMALLRAAAVFAAALACALLLPTPYETTALVHSDRDLPWTPDRLLELGVDAAVLQRIALERANDITPEAVSEAAGELISSLRIERVDARSVSISLSDAEPARAQRHCNEIARGLVERSAAWSESMDPDGRTGQREVAAVELVGFVARHSELWKEPEPIVSDAARARIRDLTAERALIQRRLTEVPETPSDNPYGSVGGMTLAMRDRFVRRTAEIDAVIANERKAQVQPVRTSADQALALRLGGLIDRVQPAPEPKAGPLLSMAREAPLPSWPIHSTRAFIILFGGLLAIGVFLFPELHHETRLRRSRRQRSERVASERPGALKKDVSTHPESARVLSAATATPLAPVSRSPASRPSGPSFSGAAESTTSSSERPASAASSRPPRPAHSEPFRQMPESAQSTDDGSLVMAYPLERWEGPAITERCRNICRDLQDLAGDASLVVTVSGASALVELRSRVALEIALLLTETPETRVLLVDADFGRAPGHPLLNVSPLVAKPFSEQLEARTAGASERRWFVTACTPTLHALLDGTNGSPKLITSAAFRACLSELQDYYDFIVLAGPPLERPNECRAADAASDTVVVVHGENEPLNPRSWPFSKRLLLLSLRT